MKNSKPADVLANQQGDTQADMIRKICREILEANDRVMTCGELVAALKKRKVKFRSDLLLSTLGVSGSGFDIQPRVGFTNIRLRLAVREGVRAVKKKEGKQTEQEKKLTIEQFVLKAIETLVNPGYKGIHTVFSGFNAAFKKYFPDLNPIEETQKLSEAGIIIIKPAKKGVMLFKVGDTKPIITPEDALNKMGLTSK